MLWSGLLVSETGHQLTHVAVLIQVFQLTHSPVALGLVGLATLVGLLLSGVVGGAIVDAFDRRKVLLTLQVLLAGTSGLLLAGALMGDPPLALIYTAVGAAAVFGGIDAAARNAMIPTLVGKELVPAAIALGQVIWNTALILGPAVGGLLIEKVGLAWAYGADAATYGATFLAALAMQPRPHTHEGITARQGLRSIREGFAFLRGKRVLKATFAIDLIAMIFGMPRILFPVLAVARYSGGAQVVGLMFSAVGVGALIGALTAGWVGRVRRQGLAVITAVALWGLAIALFGFSGGSLWLALVLLAVAGGADVISAVFRSTILQTTVPDSLRGRLNGIHIFVVAGGPRIGDLEAGLVAAAFTPMISVVSGGVAVLVGVAVLAALVPDLARYRPSDKA